MVSPYISRVEIENFRNFKSIDVRLGHKQVIVGENNVGKTNFLRAIQLILDPSFSDTDRKLSKSDFHDSIENPLESGEVIKIAIELKGYEKILQLVANLRDAVISDDPPTLRLVYVFQPILDENKEIIRYDYLIYQGNNPENSFTHQNRSLLNIKVIRALRDVERELKSLKKSPIFQLVNQFEIPKSELEDIAIELKKAADTVMDLDEIKIVQSLLVNKFQTVV
ncbi:MAG: AAA family ATPase [Fulvivirga sp.]|uniref:AAA family ATPase n=1 Tax=Fulvivirga sp. TaxID=1931237 RepID=UPI0032EE35CF